MDTASRKKCPFYNIILNKTTGSTPPPLPKFYLFQNLHDCENSDKWQSSGIQIPKIRTSKQSFSCLSWSGWTQVWIASEALDSLRTHYMPYHKLHPQYFFYPPVPSGIRQLDEYSSSMTAPWRRAATIWSMILFDKAEHTKLLLSSPFSCTSADQQ